MIVRIGKTNFFGPFQHWGVCFGSTWFEIGKDTSGGNFIKTHGTDEDFKQIKEVGYTDANIEQVRSWCENWLDSHPFYAVNGNNCQLFARHAVLEFCGVAIQTQNNRFADQALGFSLASAAVSLLSIVFSIWVRHQ